MSDTLVHVVYLLVGLLSLRFWAPQTALWLRKYFNIRPVMTDGAAIVFSFIVVMWFIVLWPFGILFYYGVIERVDR